MTDNFFLMLLLIFLVYYGLTITFICLYSSTLFSLVSYYFRFCTVSHTKIRLQEFTAHINELLWS